MKRLSSLVRPGRRRLLAMVLLLALVATACGNDDETPAESQGAATTAAGPTKLRVAYVPATTTLPLHVAKQTGIFERNNLDVTLSEAANISDLPATLGRQFDIALGTATDLIRAGGAGLDMIQIAGNTVSTKANPFVQIIVPAGSGITDLAQLKDKRVGSPTLSGVIHAGVLYAAEQKGVDPSSIRGVEAPSPTSPTSSRRDGSTPSRHWSPSPQTSSGTGSSPSATPSLRSPTPWQPTSGSPKGNGRATTGRPSTASSSR